MSILCHSNMCQLLFQAGLLITCLRRTFAAANPEGTVYEKVGGTAVLQPGSAVTGHIRTVTWKHGADKAAELYRGETICYQQYEDRCELNTTTGELTIKHLTLSHSGRYSVEINGYDVNTVQLQVMSPVPKPSVSTWCDPTKTYCLLTCEGTTSDPESLQYRWNEGNDWSSSMKVLNITKENKEPEFSCEIKNPVSSSRSDPVQNPFITGNLLWIIAVVLVILLIVSVVVVFYKKKNIWQKDKETAAPEADPEQRTGEAGDEEEPGETTELLSQSGGVQQESREASSADVHHGSAQSPGAAGASASNTHSDGVQCSHLKLLPQVMNILPTLFPDQGVQPVVLRPEMTELLSQSGGVQQESRGDVNNPPDGSSPVSTSSAASSADVHHGSAQSPGAAGSSASNTHSEGTVYEKVGGTAVLHPGSALTGKITNILWKYNGSKAIAWGGKRFHFYQQFKDHCELNTETGELTIKHLTLSDSGFYSVEINSKETNTVQLQVMSDGASSTV